MMNKYLDVRCWMFDVGCSMNFGPVSRPILRHRILLAALCSLLTWLCLSGWSEVNAPPATDASPPLPEAKDVLSKVRARMPGRPLLIKGRLLSGKRVGRMEKACYVDALLHLGQEPATARYTVTDLFGTPAEQLTVIRNPDLTPELRYEKGYPLKSAPAPDLDGAIQGTDITWNDLTLSFLWWQNGTVIGRENRRSRDCVILEFALPLHHQVKNNNGIQQSAGSAARPTVRLWIDEKLFMIIQMEEYDAKGNRLRRLSVKKIKKIADTWMVKDMEVRTYPSRHRTLLRIDNILYVQEEPKKDPTP
ncbi:outer membrane lipoprotein-sorting protein [Verrucomicrobiota bacterium]